MEVDEVTVPSPDSPEGLSFGPVTVESGWEDRVNPSDEVAVTVTPRCCECLGVRWYLETYRTRGVFSVARSQILFHPTAPGVVERAIWWRRLGYRVLARVSPRAHRTREHSAL